MWQRERPGSGCSPPRLLLLVYTYLCALGGEWFPFSARVCVTARARVYVALIHEELFVWSGGAEILPAVALTPVGASLLHVYSCCWSRLKYWC